MYNNNNYGSGNMPLNSPGGSLAWGELCCSQHLFNGFCLTVLYTGIGNKLAVIPDDVDVFVHLAKLYSFTHPMMHLGAPCPDDGERFPDGITSGSAWYLVTGCILVCYLVTRNHIFTVGLWTARIVGQKNDRQIMLSLLW